MSGHTPHPQSPLTIYFCDSENCQPRHFYGPAVRPHYLLHVILRGRGIYQHRGITYTLSQGDAFLIPPIEITYYQADETDPWSYAWVGFDGTEVPQLLSHTVFSDSVIFRNTDPERISAFTGQMLRLLEAFSENPSDLLTSTGHLLLLFSFMHKAAPESYSEVSLQYLTKAKEYLKNNYAYPVRISDTARYTGIDRTYLYRIFMEHEHLSPKEYLMRHRLRTATEMLCTTDYSITEIALSCGFRDGSAFSGYFRNQVGMTPREFRRGHRGSV